MTTPTPPTETTNAFGAPADPKTAANDPLLALSEQRKARKQRNRKIWIGGVIGVLLLVGVANSGESSSSDDKGDSVSAKGGGSAAAPAKRDSKTGRVGQAVKNSGMTYKVTKVTRAQTIGDPAVFGEKAEAGATFVLVTLSLTNTKNETKTFVSESAKLKTSGASYSPSDKATLALADTSLMLKEVQPDLPTSGVLAFEVPTARVAGARLEVEDLFGNGHVTVNLGL